MPEVFILYMRSATASMKRKIIIIVISALILISILTFLYSQHFNTSSALASIPNIKKAELIAEFSFDDLSTDFYDESYFLNNEYFFYTNEPHACLYKISAWQKLHELYKTSSFENDINCFKPLGNKFLLGVGGWESDLEPPDNKLICLDQDGSELWKAPIPFVASQINLFDGKIFIPVSLNKYDQTQQYMIYDFSGNYLDIKDFQHDVELFRDTYIAFNYDRYDIQIKEAQISEYNAKGEVNFTVTLKNHFIDRIEKIINGDYLLFTYPRMNAFHVLTHLSLKNRSEKFFSGENV